MKKIFIYTGAIMLLTGFILTSSVGIAQEPPHPPTSGHGQSGNQNPTNGGAPLGEGLVILAALGLARAGYKSSALTRKSE